jgi:hypothetical protein
MIADGFAGRVRTGLAAVGAAPFLATGGGFAGAGASAAGLVAATVAEGAEASGWPLAPAVPPDAMSRGGLGGGTFAAGWTVDGGGFAAGCSPADCVGGFDTFISEGDEAEEGGSEEGSADGEKVATAEPVDGGACLG